MSSIVQTGMILKGRYCILDRLGSGGEGAVYLARDLELGSVWAVKEIPLAQKKEAKLMRLLEHPSLPRMIDYVERGENCYLVMEYIQGRSLRECLQNGQEFSPEQVLALGLAIAKVLKYLHGQDPPVCYGDLKPENLLLSKHGKLYLVDLGSASGLYDGLKRTLTGTYGYAAPEQLEGQVKKNSDVYALGKTLWELIGKKRVRCFLRYPGFLPFLLRCCQKRADWRYPDMTTVVKKLKKLRKTGRPGKLWGTIPLILSGFLFLFTVLFHISKEPELLSALNEITEIYYSQAMLDEESGRGIEEEQTDSASGRGRTVETQDRMHICRQTEAGLQKLLKHYYEPEEQQKLYLLLAGNAEFGGEWEHAALYYEQLLLYQPGFRQGYGEYGCFLLRVGRWSESLRLWENYKEKEREGILTGDTVRNIQIWESKIKKLQNS